MLSYGLSNRGLKATPGAGQTRGSWVTDTTLESSQFEGTNLSPSPGNQELCLKEVVERVVRQYLTDMGGTDPDNLHTLIVNAVEHPLIQTVLEHTGGNQSRAADILGITRTTLRNRIKRYQLDQ